MSVMLVSEQLLNALQYGVMLFLIASGLTLVLGIMNTLNLAHGALFMLAAYLAVATYGMTHSFVAAAAGAVAGVAAVAAALEVLVMRQLYERDHLDQVLASFGLLLLLTEAAPMLWGRASLEMPAPAALAGSVAVGTLRYPAYRLFVTGAGLLIAAMMYWAIHHTRIGIQIRAGATNRTMLACCGVNVRKLFFLVFCAGAALAGAAGLLVSPLVAVDASMGDAILTLCFVIVAIGGLGSVRGAFVAALAVGFVDTFGRAFLPSVLGFPLGPAVASVGVYAFMAAVLIWRPRGLFPVRI
ncbi:branched-chain amino acid ABC transporter permease [Ramlibacter sp. AN1133]|uniref:branched-chain amino acid ABC transporter permease n=1 Tax=Ramlibacter sp. AN1133 TaxID=3133429 RepID=UPI0030C2B2C8